MRDAAQPKPKVLRLVAVLTRTGKSQSGVYEGVSAGTFPGPIRIGPRAVGWLEDEIDDWVAQRIAERDAKRKLAPPVATTTRAPETTAKRKPAPIAAPMRAPKATARRKEPATT